MQLGAEQFSYKHKPGDKFRILSVTNEEVFLNGKFSHRSEILEKISSEVIEINNDKALIDAIFQSAEKILPENVRTNVETAVSKTFSWTEETKIAFSRDTLGKLIVDRKYVLPTVRDVPVFPERDLAVGDSWIAGGMEVHDFQGNFGIKNTLEIPFKANYKYLGEREFKGALYPAFSIEYSINSRPNGYLENQTKPDLNLNGRSTSSNKANPAPVVSRITGTTSELLFWDRELGQARASVGDFTLGFLLSDKTFIEFRAHAEAEIIEAETMERDVLANDIAQEIRELGIENADVKIVDEGIMISLDNIQFAADSALLLPSEHAKLRALSEILQKYSSRDILVGGHTALAGSAGERQRLSTERARAVADWFVDNAVRSPERIMTRGFGAEKPIADNRTEAGRSKNRRVEITILEN